MNNLKYMYRFVIIYDLHLTATKLSDHCFDKIISYKMRDACNPLPVKLHTISLLITFKKVLLKVTSSSLLFTTSILTV